MRVGVWDWLWAWLAAGALFNVGAHFRNLFYAAVPGAHQRAPARGATAHGCSVPPRVVALAPRSLAGSVGSPGTLTLTLSLSYPYPLKKPE